MSLRPGSVVCFCTIIYIVLGGMISSCKYTEGWTETDWKLAAMGISPQDRAIDDRKDRLWRGYTFNVLYVGMPEEEFVRLFSNQAGSGERPYTIEQSNHRYVFLEFPALSKTDKARVTFENGRLVKYERFGLGTNPWGYSNSTVLLRPAKGVKASWE